MNRQQRRAAARKRRKLGEVIRTQGFIDRRDGQHYWFECPENFSLEDGIPPGVTVYGPFKTDAESKEHQRITLLGPQCEVTEGGEWDPNWDKPQ